MQACDLWNQGPASMQCMWISLEGFEGLPWNETNWLLSWLSIQRTLNRKPCKVHIDSYLNYKETVWFWGTTLYQKFTSQNKAPLVLEYALDIFVTSLWPKSILDGWMSHNGMVQMSDTFLLNEFLGKSQNRCNVHISEQWQLDDGGNLQEAAAAVAAVAVAVAARESQQPPRDACSLV